MKPLYIFDLDGTLALIEHRRPLIEQKPPDWPAFYKACIGDRPNWSVIIIMEALRKHSDIWIFSGRSDEVRDETIQWLTDFTTLTKKELEDTLSMRPKGDYTPDDKLKKQWLDGMLKEDRERLVAVFEDRDRMVKMWREAGLTCLQVAPGEF